MPDRIQNIVEDSRHFVKFFLLDAKSNMNDWGVTQAALEQNIGTFIGQPFILRAEFDHPNAFSGDELLRVQEADRVGDITSVGIEKATGKAWGIAEILDKNASDMLKAGEVAFVSPSIVFSATDLIMVNGIEKVARFDGAHVAAVKEPAYGMQKAQIKGQCSGSQETCSAQLLKVEASISKSKCGKIIKIANKDNVILMSNEFLKDLLEANIDPDSLANITVIDLLEKRKGECLVDQLGNCVKDSSDKRNKTSKQAIMSKKAEDEEKDKEDANEEELEERRKDEAEDEEEKKESKKGQDDEDDKMDADEDEEKKDAEDDEDKKDDARIATVIKELKALKAEYRKAVKQPTVESILSAKISAGHITQTERSAEATKLYSMSAKDLKDIAATYEKVGNASKRPYSVLEYKSASIEKKGEGDSFLMELGCKGN